MTEQHYNNGKTILDSRNRIKDLQERLQADSNISVIDELKTVNSEIYTQIRKFAIEILVKEQSRLQAIFDELKE